MGKHRFVCIDDILTAMVIIIMVLGDAFVCPGFLTPVYLCFLAFSHQCWQNFSQPLTPFLTNIGGERWKIAGLQVRWHQPDALLLSYPAGLLHKEKWRKNSNACYQHFFFPNNVFKSLLLTFFQTSPCSYVSAVQFFWKHGGKKKKLLVTRNCSFFHSVFYPLRQLAPISIKFKIVTCEHIQFGRVWNLSFGKGGD